MPKTTVKEEPIERFYVQDFIRQKLHNEPELRNALLYQESEMFNINLNEGQGNKKKEQDNLKAQTLMENTQHSVKDMKAIVNQQGVKIKSLGNTKEELIKDLYQQIFANPQSQPPSSNNEDNKKVQITNININTTNNNIFQSQSAVSSRERLNTNHMHKRSQLTSRGIDRASIISLPKTANNSSSKPKSRPQTMFKPDSSAGTRSPSKNLKITQNTGSQSNLFAQTHDLNEIFKNNKDAKLANFLIKMHNKQVNEKFTSPRNSQQQQEGVEFMNNQVQEMQLNQIGCQNQALLTQMIGNLNRRGATTSRDVSYRHDFKQKDKDMLLNKIIFNQNTQSNNQALGYTNDKLNIITNNNQKPNQDSKIMKNLAKFSSEHFPMKNTEFKDFNFLSSFTKNKNENPSLNINEDLISVLNLKKIASKSNLNNVQSQNTTSAQFNVNSQQPSLFNGSIMSPHTQAFQGMNPNLKNSEQFQDKNQLANLHLAKSQSVAISPQRFRTQDLAGLQQFNFGQKASFVNAFEENEKNPNAQNNIDLLDRLLLGGGGNSKEETKSAKFGNSPSPSPQFIKNGSIKFKFDELKLLTSPKLDEKDEAFQIKPQTNNNNIQHSHTLNAFQQQPEQKYLPTDIKHLEHIIQYTQPNQMTQFGSVLCQRKNCLEDYHQNQQHQKNLMELAKRKEAYMDDGTKLKDKDDEQAGGFEEECENFMRNLHKYYDKFINNENAFMQKSYLESNMFSNKRRTIENLIRNKQVEHGIIKADGSVPLDLDAQKMEQEIDIKQQIINRLIGTTPEQDRLEKEKELENPYAELFGVYDFRYYNSKLPQPPKEPLGKPSSRKQVQLLNEWFESMMEQYVYNQKDFLMRDDQRKKAFYYSKVILTICIRDIVRQVSVHCIERGAFMEKVLNIYLSIYEAELRTHLHDIDMQKEKHIEQIKNIREQTRMQLTNFEKLMDNLNVKIKEITQQRDRYQGETEKLKDTIAKMQRSDSYQYYQSQLKNGRSFGQASLRGGQTGQRLLQQIGQRVNEQFSMHASPRKLVEQIKSIESSSDSNSDKHNLAMKKTKMPNKAREGLIQRSKVMHKNSQKRIRIAESSDSFLTDEDKTKKKSQKGSSSSDSEEEYSFNDESKQNTQDALQTQTLDEANYAKKSTMNLIKRSTLRLLQNETDKLTNKRTSLNLPDMEINEEDQLMIKGAIDILVDDQNNPQNNLPQDGIILEADELLYHQNTGNYSLNKDDTQKNMLDQSLDFIEKEQRIRLIQQISEISSQLYNQDGKTLTDEEKVITQKDFVHKIVEQVMKNGQQTILKLIQRISDEDKLQLHKLLGDKNSLKQLQNDPTLSMADMVKENQLSKTHFLKYAQKRNSNLNNVKRFIGQKDGEGMGQNIGPSGPGQDADTQTEDFNFIDYDQLAVETAQIYMFDRVSRKLKKIVVEVDPQTGQKIFNQYEFSYKGHQDDILLQLKSSIAKKLEAEFKYKVETKNKHYEINRANRTLKSILQRISELELDCYSLQVQKGKLQEINVDTEAPLQTVKNESLAYQSGFVKGFEQARSSGYFKGYQEGKHFGHQLGFQDGVKEGWNFGFDDGYKQGIRRIFKECRDIGINIDQLDIMEFINKEDQYYGLKRYAFEKIFKIISKNEKLQLVYKIHDKFQQYNEKRKKRFAKMGRKNVIKMISQLYSQMIQNYTSSQTPNYMGILEYMYDDFSKKYGNVKLAEKKIMQILGSTYYHIDSHPKITFFGLCLHLSKRGFSNDVLFFYLQTMEKIQSSNVGILIKQDDKSDIDIIPYLKALDGIKLVFEDKLPVEAYGRVRQEVDRFTITKERAKVVDLDKLLEHIIMNFLRYSTLLTNQMDQIYHAFTLYENYFMSYHELMMLIELADPPRLRVDTENYKYIEIEKKEFISLFEKKKMELGDINISIFQFREIFGSANIHSYQNIIYCFEQSKNISTVNQCKEVLDGMIKDMNLLKDEIYRGQKWKNLKFLETQDTWVQRLNRLERSMFHSNKRDLYGDGKDDDEEIDLLELNGGGATAQELGFTQSGAHLPLLQTTQTMSQQNLQSHNTIKFSSSKRPTKISAFGNSQSNAYSPSHRLLPFDKDQLSPQANAARNNQDTNPNNARSPNARSSDSEEDYLIEDLLDRQKRGSLVYNENFLQQVQQIAGVVTSSGLGQHNSNTSAHNYNASSTIKVSGLETQQTQSGLQLPLRRQKSTINEGKMYMSAAKLSVGGGSVAAVTGGLGAPGINKNPIVRQSSYAKKPKPSIKKV
eukprot:403354987